MIAVSELPRVASSCSRLVWILSLALSSGWLAACGKGAAPPPPASARDAQTTQSLPADVVEASALPLLLRFKGKERDFVELIPMLSKLEALCVGESHDNPHHHYAQWQLIQALGERARAQGRPFAVGFEMFQAPFQGALDAYVQAGDQQTLLDDSEFESRWGKNTFAFYRPLLEAGRATGARLLALNAARETTKLVARGGLEALSESQRQSLPELNLADPEHRNFFEAALGLTLTQTPAASEKTESAEPELPASPPASAPASPDTSASAHHAFNPEHLYTAQVVWDESMADAAARWLDQASGGQVVIIAGAGHCHRSAIPRRLKRRGFQKVIAARAVLHSELGKGDAPRDDQFDLLVVLDDAQPNSSVPQSAPKSEDGVALQAVDLAAVDVAAVDLAAVDFAPSATTTGPRIIGSEM